MALLNWGSRSQEPNKLGTLQVPTSEYGVTVPMGWGTFKAPIKLLDYTDFVADQESDSGKGGGNYYYEYYAAVDCVLCKGPINGIGDVYDGGGASSLVGTTESYTIPTGGGSYQVQNGGAQFYYNEGVTKSMTFSVTADDYGSDGELVISGTQQVPMQEVALNTVGAGEYSVTTGGLYAFNGADAGTTVTISYAYTTADTDFDSEDDQNNRSPMLRYALTCYTGTRPGTQWSYMASKHPERALAYPGMARVCCPNMDLGNSATLPALSVEVLNARLKAFGAGVADCDPAVILADMLGDPVDGCNWPYLGDTTQFSNFCVANQMFMSPFYDSQRKATDVISEICDLASAAPVWSPGAEALKIVPYGDTTAVAYGRTFSPQNQPVYEISEDELLCADGEEAVKINWPDLSDNYNRVIWEYTWREDNYNTNVVYEQDEASILMNGLLPMQTVTAHHFCEQEYASVAMNIALKRKAVPLRTFEFTLPWYFLLLEPMDVILLDLEVGNLGPTPMRLVSIDEQDDYSLKCTAEDFLFGTGAGVYYPKPGNSGNGPGAHDDSGGTTMLAAFQPNTRLTSGADQLWLALAGGPTWGGCDVWLSTDGNTYKTIARQYGSARAGTLTAPLAAGSDPDTTDTVSVSINGTLASGTQSDADTYATLCLVGQEFISYESATLTGSTATTNSYNLGTYLRRGLFANNSVAHSAGEVFVRLDDQVTKYTLDPVLLGRTIFLKFTAFNLYGQNEQQLADVDAVTINLGGSMTAGNMTVSGFANSDGSTATVDVYRLGGTVGQAGSATLPNGATVTLPAQAWATEALSTWYGVNFNIATQQYVLYTNQQQWLADQATMLAIGSTTTPGAGSVTSALQYADTGSVPASNPSGAYTSGGQASLNSYAEYLVMPVGSGGRIEQGTDGGSSGVGTIQQGNGLIRYYGWAGTATGSTSLRVTAATTITAANSGSGLCTGIYTLDGNTWTTLFSETSTMGSTAFTVPIPAGTNLANVQFEATSHCSALLQSGSDATATLIVSSLSIS